MIDLKSTTPAQRRLLERIKSRNWLEDNLKELQEKYTEKWIGIVGESLVAYGNDPDEVKEKAKAKGKFSAADVMLVRVPSGELSRPA